MSARLRYTQEDTKGAIKRERKITSVYMTDCPERKHASHFRTP